MSKDFSEKRIGEIWTSEKGYDFKIIAYRNQYDIKAKTVLEDGTEWIISTTYRILKRGKMKTPLERSLYSVGYLGVGIYSTEKNKKEYKTWKCMIERCYSESFQRRNPTYIGCYVCDEWHNFQNFAKWYNENYYELDGETMCLDKDILVKGNKVYSPETCVFAPISINCLFANSENGRGDLPIGVRRSRNKYSSYAFINKKSTYLGCFNTPEDAFYAYKKAKEDYIKQVADQYKDKIPHKLYDAMYRYEVEITD